MDEWDNWDQELVKPKAPVAQPAVPQEKERETIWIEDIDWFVVPDEAMEVPEGLQEGDPVEVLIEMGSGIHKARELRHVEVRQLSWSLKPGSWGRVLAWRRP